MRRIGQLAAAAEIARRAPGPSSPGRSASIATQLPCSAISTPRSARKSGWACQATSASRQAARRSRAIGRRIVEDRRDPAVEQVAMLAEAAEPPPGLARRLDQRVERALRRAAARGRAGPRGCRSWRRSARSAASASTSARAGSAWRWAGSGCATRSASACSCGSALSSDCDQLPELGRPLRRPSGIGG